MVPGKGESNSHLSGAVSRCFRVVCTQQWSLCLLPGTQLCPLAALGRVQHRSRSPSPGSVFSAPQGTKDIHQVRTSSLCFVTVQKVGGRDSQSVTDTGMVKSDRTEVPPDIPAMFTPQTKPFSREALCTSHRCHCRGCT